MLIRGRDEIGRKLGTRDVIPQFLLALGEGVDGPSVLNILPIRIRLTPILRFLDHARRSLPLRRRQRRERRRHGRDRFFTNAAADIHPALATAAVTAAATGAAA